MVLLILVDALSSEFLTKDNMPFLYEWAQGNNFVKRIHANCGYCERTEIFTGMYPDISKNFTAIGYSDSASEYNNRLVLKMMSLSEKVSKRNTRRLFNIYSKITKKKMLGYFIPFQIIGKFQLTEDYKSHEREDAFVGESIFSILNSEHKKYSLELFTSLGGGKIMSDQDRVTVLKTMLLDDYDFLPLYIGMIDAMGHKNVDDPIKMKKYLLTVDAMIEDVIKESLRQKGKEINIMVLGDHGMEKVETIIDFEEVLKTIPLKKFVDYTYFLDSTIARFWCEKKKQEIIKEKVNEILGGKGFWVDETLSKKYHIPLDQSKVYGDIIWCANTGGLIYPDFFNKEIDKGMHGYAVPTSAGKGLCVFSGGNQRIEEGNLVDVCPTLCKMLSIRTPNLCAPP